MTDPQPHRHATASKMQRTKELQPIAPAKMHPLNVMGASELHELRKKARNAPIRIDIAGPTRITNASMPVCTEEAYPYPSHLSEGRLKANNLPSLEFGRRHYRDGRIEDLDGNVIKDGK